MVLRFLSLQYITYMRYIANRPANKPGHIGETDMFHDRLMSIVVELDDMIGIAMSVDAIGGTPYAPDGFEHEFMAKLCEAMDAVSDALTMGSESHE